MFPDRVVEMKHKQVLDNNLSLSDAVENFILDQEIGNRAGGTLAGFRYLLQNLCAFAEERGWPPLEELGRAEMREYLADWKSRPRRWAGKEKGPGQRISESYFESIYRRLKRFFKWCVVEGYISVNPLGDIPRPKVGKRVVSTVSEDQFCLLLKLTDPGLFDTPARKFRALRDQAVLWMFMDTPGRRHEIARLTVDRVDLKERRVLVEGKGRKERFMYLGAVTTRAMMKYKTARDGLGPWTDDWWVDWLGNGMRDNWLYLMLKRVGERAGIQGLHPHQFRHTFSINMIESNVPLPTLEVMGGWERIPQTYLATLGDRAARAAHRRASPADRLAGRR